jgi:hypothetical protein
MRRATLTGLLGFLILVPAAGLPPAAAMASLETAEAREALRDELIEGELWRVEAWKPRIVSQGIFGSSVRVTTREQGGKALVEFRIVADGAGRPSLAGTFTLTRSLQDGRSLSFRVTLRDEPGCYLEAKPWGDRSLLDLYLFDDAEPLYREVVVPLSFQDLLTSSLQRLVTVTQTKVDWDLVLYHGSPAEDRIVEALAGAIRARLQGLRDADDGAIDERGRFVTIATLAAQPRPGGLNCSGFVKWVVDGFVYPLTGRNTSVADAKRKDVDVRGTPLTEAQESLDPFFGLDWTRNLAVLLGAARRGDGSLPGIEDSDVRDTEPSAYIEDVGYPVASLNLLLYRRAAAHAGDFYLAAVSDLTGPGGLRQFFHTAVILPYFDAGGAFRVRVFERLVESSLASLVSRYPGAYVHLVRAPAAGRFAPLEVP